jgi:hypothetical protein
MERLPPSNAGDDEMKTTIDMAREVYGAHTEWSGAPLDRLEQLVALVRADERNSWPAEMEAMERQVNILTDALAAEREACAKLCETLVMGKHCAAAIRARGSI